MYPVITRINLTASWQFALNNIGSDNFIWQDKFLTK